MPLSVQEISDLVPRLLLFARQWTDCADDAVQEAFLGLFRLQTPPNDEVGWLFTATRNHAVSIHRSETSRTRRENNVASTTPNWFEPTEADQLDGKIVTQELQKLPPELREVVAAKIWGGLTFEQIAISTQTSTATAYRRYNEAIAVLRNRLKIDE